MSAIEISLPKPNSREEGSKAGCFTAATRELVSTKKQANLSQERAIPTRSSSLKL
jgi:hypothetical protein